ncbi:MAG: phage tail sheath family protein [Leptothrix sp. (in: Bacteria)]|jgi:phage tail sheath protein FI|nr:phage tail sheath family protein [Leptothrix sp. (in: b-proteobacteria)]
MATYRTPDVYIEEVSVFPPSVAEVETAIPAFIGYTERARKLADNDLRLLPTKIYSLAEYEQYFGLAKDEPVAVALAGTAPNYVATVAAQTATYLMWYALKLFFDNGGGKCYIVSVGGYAAVSAITAGDLTAGLTALASEDEPTLIVIPEAARLADDAQYGTLAQAVLLQCGTLKDRFAIFDLPGGAAAYDSAAVAAARGRYGNNHLKYGAAYYPHLRSTLTHRVRNADDGSDTNVDVTIGAAAAVDLGTLKDSDTSAYNTVKAALQQHYVVLPPSGAVAGVYAAVDTSRGVWKAPANVSLNDVVEPAVKIDNTRQDELNVDATTGKSINAIRAFAGKGTLVWGARTLAGNDNEWRYVSVRRFFNMVEESVKKSTYWAVFEPNDANTWVKVRGMIESYLTQKWREGALAGATTKDAFYVRCGLGVTMNAQDILEGRMNVEIGMAVVRPAEFIILKFSHKLQTS